MNKLMLILASGYACAIAYVYVCMVWDLIQTRSKRNRNTPPVSGSGCSEYYFADKHIPNGDIRPRDRSHKYLSQPYDDDIEHMPAVDALGNPDGISLEEDWQLDLIKVDCMILEGLNCRPDSWLVQGKANA